MFFSQFVPNDLLTNSGYLLKRVVLRFFHLQVCRVENWDHRGVSKGTIVKSVLFGVPGLGLARIVGVCVTVFMMLTTPSSAEDRTLTMFNIHTQETISITFKHDGKYVPEALNQLNHFMRDWRVNLEHKIDPALLDLLYELHQDLGSKEPIHLVCGYRSPQTNEMLRRTSGGQARNSRHLTGQAADIIFPDIPLKQLRYAALSKERGGVGYYPRSGLPFVHVDTGGVRHWPGISRTELALIFPNGYSRHIPDDGRPLTPADSHIALAKWQAAGNELPWILSHKRPSGTMLASATPKENPLFHRASLTQVTPIRTKFAAANMVPDAIEMPESPPSSLASAAPLQKPGQLTPTKVRELLWEADDEPEDDAEQEAIPIDVLFSEKPIAYLERREIDPHAGVFQKFGILLSSPTTLTSEEFGRGPQLDTLNETNTFKGAAIAFIRQRRMTQEAMVAHKSAIH